MEEIVLACFGQSVQSTFHHVLQYMKEDMTATFMAKAISVRDLIEQVSKMCPEGSPIPSLAWVQYNFASRNQLLSTTQVV